MEQIDQQTGQAYYYNERTGESQWEAPYGMGGGASHGGASQDGWVTQIDQESGQMFYYNEHTGASQWEPPSEASDRILWRLEGFSGRLEELS